MPESLITFEQFASWLCRHEREIVGRPGMCFHSPLARFLSDEIGGVWGVDERYYGKASKDYFQWQFLPRWAQLFVGRLERWAFRPITGDEALVVLAEIELMLTAFHH